MRKANMNQELSDFIDEFFDEVLKGTWPPEDKPMVTRPSGDPHTDLIPISELFSSYVAYCMKQPKWITKIVERIVFKEHLDKSDFKMRPGRALFNYPDGSCRRLEAYYIPKPK